MLDSHRQPDHALADSDPGEFGGIELKTAQAAILNEMDPNRAAVLATTLSVWFGIPATFAAAGVIYLVAAWASPARWRPVG